MTKTELQKANANEILGELCYCGRDPYYADYYENVTTEIKNRLERITELEQENNKLLDVINNQDVKIADLEKQIKQIEKVFDYNADQLTKAKEIIALGLRVCETSSIEYMNLYQKQAEQFLKETDNDRKAD